MEYHIPPNLIHNDGFYNVAFRKRHLHPSTDRRRKGFSRGKDCEITRRKVNYELRIKNYEAENRNWLRRTLFRNLKFVIEKSIL
jgi:hypothetical protein